MVDRDVNPLEQRHLALSARFKAAWAFHQLLMGMHRLNSGIEFQNRSDTPACALNIGCPGDFEKSMPAIVEYFEKNPIGDA